LYNKGIEELKTAVFSVVTDQSGPADLPGIVPNLRHKLAIQKAVTASRMAIEGFEIRRHPELVAIDLKDALDALGDVVGSTTSEDILHDIFNRFCIGK
jgi:tRNA modification GTPase